MPLRITLKAGERLIVGGAVVRTGSRCDLLIENDVPVLRGREVLGLDEANTPCRRIYFAIQLMYVDPVNLARHQELYLELVREVLQASPSMTPLLTEIGEQIAVGRYYPALKLGRKLIGYERELISKVARS